MDSLNNKDGRFWVNNTITLASLSTDEKDSLLESIWAAHDKTNEMSCAPSETQISLGIRPVWTVFAVRMKKAWVLSYPRSVHSEDWSDRADAQADLSLLWAHMSICWFCQEAAHLWNAD